MNDWSGFQLMCVVGSAATMALTCCLEGCSVNESHFQDLSLVEDVDGPGNDPTPSTDVQTESSDAFKKNAIELRESLETITLKRHRPSENVCESIRVVLIAEGKVNEHLPDPVEIIYYERALPECGAVYEALKYWWVTEKGFSGDKRWELCQLTRLMIAVFDPATTPGGQAFMDAHAVTDDCDLEMRGTEIWQ